MMRFPRLLLSQLHNNIPRVVHRHRPSAAIHFLSTTTTTAPPRRTKLPDLQPLLEQQQQPSTAEQNLLTALRRTTDDDDAQLHNLRDCYAALNYWDYALETELDMAATHSTSRDVVESLLRQAHYHWQLQQPVAAGQVLQQALQLEPDHPRVVTSWAVWQFRARKEYRKALEYLERAVELLEEEQAKEEQESSRERENGDGYSSTRQWIVCLQYQGLMWRHLGEFDKALKKYQEALEKCRKLPQQPENYEEDGTGSTELYQSLRLDCADMHNALEEWDAAMQLYEELLDEITSKTSNNDDDDASRAVLLHNLGKLYLRQCSSNGDSTMVSKARSALQESIEIKRRLDASSGEIAKTCNVLGTLEAIHNPEDRAVAMAYFQQSLLLVRGNDDDDESHKNELVMQALRNIAVLKGQKVAKWSTKPDSRGHS